MSVISYACAEWPAMKIVYHENDDILFIEMSKRPILRFPSNGMRPATKLIKMKDDGPRIPLHSLELRGEGGIFTRLRRSRR